jgi:hypothetical protein
LTFLTFTLALVSSDYEMMSGQEQAGAEGGGENGGQAETAADEAVRITRVIKDYVLNVSSPGHVAVDTVDGLLKLLAGRVAVAVLVRLKAPEVAFIHKVVFPQLLEKSNLADNLERLFSSAIAGQPTVDELDAEVEERVQKRVRAEVEKALKARGGQSESGSELATGEQKAKDSRELAGQLKAQQEVEKLEKEEEVRALQARKKKEEERAEMAEKLASMDKELASSSTEAKGPVTESRDSVASLKAAIAKQKEANQEREMKELTLELQRLRSEAPPAVAPVLADTHAQAIAGLRSLERVG